MIAYILNRYATTSAANFVKDYIEIDSYSYVTDYDYKGNSTVTTCKKPNALEGDFLFVCKHGPIYTLTMSNGDVLTMDNDDELVTDTLKGMEFGGIIDKISESNGIYTITVSELAQMFDEDVVVTNWSTASSAGIEDFFLANILLNFRDATFTKFNNDYVSFSAKTHTPYSGLLETDNGIINIKDELAEFLQDQSIRLNWSIGSDGIGCEIEKKPRTVRLNVLWPCVSTYTEETTSNVLSQLNVKWLDTTTNYTYTYVYVMDNNGSVKLKSKAKSRLEGYSSSLYVKGGTSTELQTKIKEQFNKNQYKHKVSITMKDWNNISFTDLYPGQVCYVGLSDGTVEKSIINKITKSSDSDYYKLELGNLEVTLTDKLRRLI